jgi:transcriptional regulator GlxA family with amidase domain
LRQDQVPFGNRKADSYRYSCLRETLSRAQFTRRFIAHAGMSPARYLIRARIDRARQLLTETNMSVTQVAQTLGYPDIAYFSRQYKRHTGHPPGRR